MIGGCGGSSPEQIRLLVKVAQEGVTRETVERRATVLSGLETLTVDEDTRPVLVGERTNVLGSRRFKRLIAEGKSNQDIADGLFISLSTVAHHVTSILGKTGSSTRTEAAAYANRNRLLP